MFHHYTLMKTKNETKDFEAKFEEWWKVAKEYFIEELEKNLAQHRANEIILKYKVEAYQKIFPDFISSNLTSIEVLGQDEEIETWPGGTTQEEEVGIKEPQDLKSGAIHEVKVQIEKLHDFRRRGQEEEIPQKIQEQEKVEVISTTEEAKIKPQIE